MALKFNISQLCPLKFYHQADAIATNAPTTDFAVFPSNYNHRHIDDDFAYRSLKSWESKTCYFQPWQQSDVIVLQFLGQEFAFGGTINPYYVRIIDSKGKVIKSQQPTTPGLLGTDTIYNIKFGLWNVPEGKYYVQLKFQGYFADLDAYMISEPIEVKQYHENTMLFEGKNSFNDQGIIWAYNYLEMQLRVHCALIELSPENKSNVYNNQPMDATLISAVPYRDYNLVFGQNGQYIHDWFADKLNRFLSLDNLKLDGKGITRKQGATLSAKRIEGYPLSKWSIPVNEASSGNDILITSTQRINIGAVPNTDLFYIKGLYLTSITAYFSPTFETYFAGRQNFLDYLNGWFKLSYFPGYSGHFTIDANGDLIYQTSNEDEYTILEAVGLELGGVLPYGLQVDVKPNGTIDFDIKRLTANTNLYYASVWGNGTQQNYATTTSSTLSQSKTYTGGIAYTAYIFCDDAEEIEFQSGTTDLLSMYGNLPANILNFSCANNALRYIKNNIFLSCIGGISTIDLSGNRLNTFEINKIIIRMYEAMLSGAIPTTGTNTADLSDQTPSAPPSSDTAIQSFLSHLNSNNLSVTTD